MDLSADKNALSHALRLRGALLGCALLSIAWGAARGATKPPDCGKGDFTQDFRTADCTFVNTGRMPFFVLEPGYWLELDGDEKDGFHQVTITVLGDTEVVNGVTTRVVEERERVDGELEEVSRNFFALCQETGSFFYFGESVDLYENGEVVGHEGEWRAGTAGAKPGIVMPGAFLLGSRYYQELAPSVAQDRACNAAMGLSLATPAGSFSGCVEVVETSPLESGKSVKFYCPGIGVVQDDTLKLTDWSENPN
ncbi:MAG TPA: hypothetical protein VFW45_13375 [Candidatus Polarisedimenticolia bacterium]|nr:hypothetical protein [Candidatus Polarisedimenticolia bacterium]